LLWILIVLLIVITIIGVNIIQLLNNITVSQSELTTDVDTQFKTIDDNIEKLKNTNNDLIRGYDAVSDDIRNMTNVVDNGMDSCDNSIDDMTFISEARKRYMNVNEWSYDNDCSVLTQEFTLLMKEFGIQMFKIHAFNDNSNIGHSYNCVPYDVQSGVYNEEWDSYNVVTTTKNINYDNKSVIY